MFLTAGRRSDRLGARALSNAKRQMPEGLPLHLRACRNCHVLAMSPDPTHGPGSCPVRRVPAAEIEEAVIERLRAVFRQPAIVAGTCKAVKAKEGDITEADARTAPTEK